MNVDPVTLLLLLFLIGMLVGCYFWPVVRDRYFDSRGPLDHSAGHYIPETYTYMPAETYTCASCGIESTPANRVPFITESCCCACGGAR